MTPNDMPNLKPVRVWLIILFLWLLIALALFGRYEWLSLPTVGG